MAKFNPFRPGSIVGPGMFAGRGAELLAIEQAFHQTVGGNPHHFLIHGERGIGKSSLLYFVEKVASGQIESFEDHRFSFLTVSVELQPSTTYADLILKISAELQRQIELKQPGTTLLKEAWSLLNKFEFAGIKYSGDVPKPVVLIEELTAAIKKTLDSFDRAIDGIVIFVDEADKAPASAQLGEFCKIFTERLVKYDCHQVCLGLAGITSLLTTLRASHESSPRVFEIFALEPLLPNERLRVISSGLNTANDKNPVATTISDDAATLISDLSEGYPHFIQQFAYCAFDADRDDVIDVDDVNRGSSDPDKGAIQQLGQKYFHELYFDSIGSDDYRKLLQFIASEGDPWVRKSELKKHAGLKPTTLDNALIALKNRNIIIPKRGVAGVYRLPTKAFGAWIRATKSAELSE